MRSSVVVDSPLIEKSLTKDLRDDSERRQESLTRRPIVHGARERKPWIPGIRSGWPGRGARTYLGHSHVTDTYWYLTSVPELLHLVSKQLEARTRGGG